VFSIRDSAGVNKDHCPNSPIDIGDASRIRWMVNRLDSLAAAERSAATHQSSDD
jgi:hypothetical protein